MIKRVILGIIACLTISSSTFADEGMWLPTLIKERIKEMRKMGFKLKAEDIYSSEKASLKDAVVQFGGGCTGEFVSEQGLLLTNHHCGYGSIQKLSSIEHDYLTHGYWAQSMAEELPVPGLTVSLLVSMEDVTERLAAGEKREDIIASATKGEGYRASIESIYYGNQHILYVYQTFRDVRLVGAPPSSIGKFGGDTDNWIWPRHTGDFSIFRVYADSNNQPADYSKENVPYRPKRHFKISTDGIKEGDFTMIYGFPGNTQEYVISDAVEYVANVSNPMKIALRTQRLETISAAQAKDPAVRIAYAAKHAGIANGWKKWQGESLGLERLGTVEKKKQYEAAFAEWAADKPQYASLLDSMRAAYATTTEGYFVRELFNETIGAIEAYSYARAAQSAIDRNAGDYFTLPKDYNIDIDRTIARQMIAEFMKRMPTKYIPEALRSGIKGSGSIDAYIDSLFNGTKILRQGPTALESLAGDPMLEFAKIFAPIVSHNSRYLYRNLSNVPSIEKWYRTYMQALREWDGNRAFYPDANFTLRVAYGTICGYENADGEYHTPLTTLDGIIAKDNPQIYDYDIPQELRDIYKNKEYGRWAIEKDGRTTVPVCFLASNHTSGGNSGSPVINGRGELVGINFDRTWRSTMSDIEFDPTICRNISVDIRYVLFVVDCIGGAEYLLKEVGVK